MDTKTALTCLVPVVAQIQNVRQKYDSAFERWMPPHFNIDCVPFLSESKFAEALPLLQTICQKYKELPIVLAKLGMFSASKKKVGILFAEVLEPTGALVQLHDELLTALQLPSNKAFHPHVTLGRFENQQALEKCLAEMTPSWKPIAFQLEGLHYITRDATTPFAINHFIKFGPAGVSQKVPPTADYTGTISTVGDFAIVSLQSTRCVKAEPTIVKNILVLDNSASMGSNTREALRTIGKGMFDLPKDTIKQLEGAVIIFDGDAHVLSDRVASADHILKLALPVQAGRTNITAGIETTLNLIITTAVPGTHHILTFLSDGVHNTGPVLSHDHLTTLRRQLDERGILLSINIIGITADSNTALGMQIKAGLETAPMQQLESVYYARESRDMPGVLQALVGGCVQSLCSGQVLQLQVENGIFLENSRNTMSAFVGADTYVMALKKTTPAPLNLFIVQKDTGTVPVHLDTVEPTKTDISLVIDSAMPKLSQLKVARGMGSIKPQIEVLTQFIDTFDGFFHLLAKKKVEQEPGADAIGHIKLRPADRVAMLKKVKTQKVAFLEERNKLQQLEVTLSNDSGKQAEYLTGMTKKYGAKAVLRADTLSTTPQQILLDLKKMKPDLKQAIEADQGQLQMAPDFVVTSILALTTPDEQFCEWLETLDQPTDFTDIYALLVAFGFPAYSVRFQHNNAVQMDPFQTECLFLEPCPIDTCSVLLSNQLKRDIVSPAREPITDGLILIDPMMPRASRLLLRSPIYQYLSSITLCRDLYMYHPKMTFSMHAHALVKAVAQYSSTRSKMYLELALRILYSIRQYWGDKLCAEGDNVRLFQRWWKDWQTLTQSDVDACNHPVQLLLMMGIYDFKALNCDLHSTAVPLINLLNETLARKMKTKLKGCAGVDGDTKALALETLQHLYGITPFNSPEPNPDVMQQEPTLLAVRESCQAYATMENGAALLRLGIKTDVITWVNQELLPFVQTFQFCLALQQLPGDLKTKMERGEVDDWVLALSKTMDGLPPQLNTLLKTDPVVYETMFMQATLLHDSVSRLQVDQKSVLDRATWADLIVDLRMAFYFKACKVKKDKWLAVIGDVTLSEALSCDVNVFDGMLGVHTHGLNKERFWALVRASKNHREKKTLFLKKSNEQADACFFKV